MKKLAFFLAVILMISALPGCNSSADAPYAPSGLGIMEEKRYSNATMDDDFADDRILVTIQNDYSLAFHTYTPEDFPEIKCIEVEDLSTASGELAKLIVDGDPLPSRYPPGWREWDIQNYNQILRITLKNPGKKNVLKAIEKLEKRDDILSAGPDYLLSITD